MNESSDKPQVTNLFLLVTALFVTLLITSNIVAVKIVEVYGRILPAAIILFPITYILGDVLTEVYGFQLARRVIWIGFACTAIAVLCFWLCGLLPSAPFWTDQPSYESIFGYAPRLLLASFSGYLFGEFSNSMIMSKLKLVTNGRWLWMRTISSTLVGQGIDSAIFIAVAFLGTIPGDALLELMLTQWLFKVLYETSATPITYGIVSYLKHHEGLDVYDRHTVLNPLPFGKK